MAQTKDKPDLTTVSPVGTMCFPTLFEAKPDPKGNLSYGTVLVFDPDEDLKDMALLAARALLLRFQSEEPELKAAVKKWLASGDYASNEIKIGRKKYKMPFRAGDEYAEYGEPFEEGRIFINCKSNSRPGVVNAAAKDIMDQDQIYGGCKARVNVYAWAYDTNGNTGVTFLLNNVQKAGEGKRLGGRKRASEVFGAIAGSNGNDIDDDGEDLL